jgi:hypothetical protein
MAAATAAAAAAAPAGGGQSAQRGLWPRPSLPVRLTDVDALDA